MRNWWMQKAAIYARVSTPGQHIESQLYDPRKLAQPGFEVSSEYCDKGISGIDEQNSP